MKHWITNEKYNDGFEIDLYNETYSLTAGQVGKDGNFYKKWSFPQTKDRAPSDKTIPVKITLGNLPEAIKLIEEVLAELKQEATQPEPGYVSPPKEADEGDVPF